MPKRRRWQGGFLRDGYYWIDRNAHADRFSTRKTTREGALAFLAQWEQDPEGARAAACGLPGFGQDADLSSAVGEYLKHSAAVNSAKHVRQQGAGFNRWAYYLALEGVTTLARLTPALGSGFIAWRKGGGASLIPPPAPAPGLHVKKRRAYPEKVGEAAVNRDLAAMKGLLAWMRDTARAPESFDPLRKVPLLKEHHDVNPHREVDHAHILAVVAWFDNTETHRGELRKWADLIRVLYGTAFRYSSAARLNLGSIDAGKKVLRDPYPKGKVAVEVPVSDEVLSAALRCAGRRYPMDEAQQLGRRLARACAASMVPRWTAHDLRVTAATFMHRQGVSLADLQVLLGHKSLRTTERYVRASGRLAQGPI